MKIVLISLIMIISHAGFAQTEQYDAGVAFSSIGTGTPSTSFLEKFYWKNKKSYKKLAAFKVGGCGREGEFSILFNTTGMKMKDKTAFYKKLKSLVMQQDNMNRMKNAGSGHISMSRKVLAADFAHCRIPVQPWPDKSEK